MADAECETNSRCTSVEWEERSNCKESAGVCSCTTGKDIVTGARCSPIAIAGPRGQWESLTITEVTSAVQSEWTIKPDGSIVITKTDAKGAQMPAVNKQLDPGDLEQLTAMVDGALLRARLSDTAACGSQSSGDATMVSLVLDTTTLGGDVSGCVDGANEQAPFPVLVTMVRKY